MIPGRSQAAGRDELNFNTLCSRPTWYGALHRFGSPRGPTIELPLESEGYSEASGAPPTCQWAFLGPGIMIVGLGNRHRDPGQRDCFKSELNASPEGSGECLGNESE